MRKAIIGFFSIIIVLILVAALSWNMFPSWISHKLSSQAKVAVSIGNIRLSPSSIRIDKIYVGNPPKSILKKALEVDKLTANVPITRFLDKDIVINEMRMEDIYLGLEFESKKSANGNWKTIMNNLKASTNKDKERAKKENKTKTVLIKKLILEDLKVELVYTQGDRRVRKLRPIERLELTNISSEGGIPSAQIMDIVSSETLRNIMSLEGLQDLLRDTLSSPGSVPGTVLNNQIRYGQCPLVFLHFGVILRKLGSHDSSGFPSGEATHVDAVRYRLIRHGHLFAVPRVSAEVGAARRFEVVRHVGCVIRIFHKDMEGRG